MIEFIGWMASVCFLFSGVPFMVDALLKKEVHVPWSGVLLILCGSFGMFAYEMGTAQSLPQLVDFGVTTVCWAVVAGVKYSSDAGPDWFGWFRR